MIHWSSYLMVSSQCSSDLPDLSVDYSVTYSPLRFSSFFFFFSFPLSGLHPLWLSCPGKSSRVQALTPLCTPSGPFINASMEPVFGPPVFCVYTHCLGFLSQFPSFIPSVFWWILIIGLQSKLSRSPAGSSANSHCLSTLSSLTHLHLFQLTHHSNWLYHLSKCLNDRVIGREWVGGS